jgi:hypothetical protein
LLRVLNPLEEVYWICLYCIEYLFKLSSLGEGFSPSLEQEKKFLLRKLKDKDGNNVPSSAPASSGSAKKKSSDLLFPPISSISSSSSSCVVPIPLKKNKEKERTKNCGSSKGKGKKPTLDILLNQAKKEAELECKLLNVERKLHAQSHPAHLMSLSFSSNQQHQHQYQQSSSAEEQALIISENPNDFLRQFMSHDETEEQQDQGDDSDNEEHDKYNEYGETVEEKRKRKAESRASSSALKVSMKSRIPSVVWNCHSKPLVFDNQRLILPVATEKDKTALAVAAFSSSATRRASVSSSSAADVEDDNPLKGLPTSKAAAIEYSRKLQSEKSKEHQQLLAFQQYLSDLQDSIVTKAKLTKSIQLNKLKGKLKEDIHSQELYSQFLLETKEKEAIHAKLAKEKEELLQKELLEREKLRIRELKEIKKFYDNKKQEDYQRQLQVEKIRIQSLLDRKEREEAIRREQEEQRMRYLEGLQLKKEQRRYEKELAVYEEEKKKRQQLNTQIQFAQARVRRGNFKWINGKYQYYDSVRKDPSLLGESVVDPTAAVIGASYSYGVPTTETAPLSSASSISSVSATGASSSLIYLQYDNDENGNPVYYDPLLKQYQHRVPEDGDIIYYIDYERSQYDAIHGEGAYDAMKEERAWKDSVNLNGGWYDDNGAWIIARGYYDENYEWVDCDGYYEETTGKYIKYPKVQGDLSFMV